MDSLFNKIGIRFPRPVSHLPMKSDAGSLVLLEVEGNGKRFLISGELNVYVSNLLRPYDEFNVKSNVADAMFHFNYNNEVGSYYCGYAILNWVVMEYSEGKK